MNFNLRAKNRITGLVLLLITLPVLFSACGKTTVKQPDSTFQYASFRDIPGVTEDEVKAIEALREQFDHFRYGMIPSTESFYDDNGSLRGYTALFCEWLTRLFGIPFIPENTDIFDLLDKLAGNEVDFTGVMTATEERRETYLMTTAIALRTVQYSRIAGSASLESIAKLRPLRYAFMRGASTIDLVIPKLTPGTYEIIITSGIDEAHRMLKSGEVDAVFHVNMEIAYDVYGDVVASDFFPLIYTSASLATQNPALEPVISVVQKALDSGALPFLATLYNQGDHEYLKHKLFMQLSNEERRYIQNNHVIPFVAATDNYPVSFYNERNGQWQGIAFDVVREIETFTDLRFEHVNDVNVSVSDMLNMMKNRKASMIMELMYSTERAEDFIWPQTVLMVDYFALISKSEYPNISLNEILYKKVGLIRGYAHADVFLEWFPDHHNTKEYENIRAAFGALDNGEVDLVMARTHDLLLLTNYMERTGFKTNYIFDDPAGFTFAFNKNEVILCSIVDKALRMVNTSRISDQWRNITYDYRVKVVEAQRPWLIASSVLFLGILVIVAVLYKKRINTSKLLENLVNERTHDLQLQTAILTTLFDSIPDLIFAKDLDFRYMQCNKSFLEHLGFHKEDIIGKDDLDGLHLDPELVDGYREWDRKVMKEGRNFKLEEHIPGANGTNPLYETVKMPLMLDGTVIGLLGISHDITQHKEIEYELALQNTIHTTLFDSIPDLVFTMDTSLCFTQCNENFVKHFGLSREDIIGKGEECLGFSAELIEEHSIWNRVVINEGRRVTFDERIPCIDGTEPLHETIKVPLMLDGEVTGLLFISRNITKRKEMEDAALSASRSKSAFLANMSHEIRTPMNSIMGFSELAMDGEASAKTRDYLSKIKTNAEWLLQIINDILDISKIESGKMELENIPFDMHELFTSCRTLITPKADEKGIALRFYAEPSIGKRPLGDPTRLRQVFINLLSNAVKFTNLGTVKVLAEIKGKSEKTVTMHFEIKDSGIGMTEEQIERIFDPFTQAETGTTRQYGGTGLGLSITKNMVELMGGKLTVESTLGVGSKFAFDLTFDTIDVDEEKFEKKIVFNEIEKPLFEGEVLLCEDNVMNQQVICEHLARVGLKTVVADNGKIGVELVQERIKNGVKQFDLIFMDMHMPVMDGIEASARIIQLDTDIPIVAMTANIMSSDLEIYKQSGMNDYVGKPFTSQELWRCLLKYLKPLNRDSVRMEAPVADNNPLEADEEFQKNIQRSFVKGNRDKYAEIVKALEEGDVKLAHRLAHTLKSNAGQIGRDALRQAAADVEDRLKEGKAPVTEQLKLLETELTAVLNELSLLTDETSPVEEAAGPLDADAARELVEKLEPMLKLGKPESQALIDGIRRIPGNGELAGRLIQQIEDFDFEEAAVTLDELRKKLAI